MYYLRAKAAILYPGNVLPVATAAFNRPGKVSLAQQQHHQKKKSFIF
jgi:hypothetical protein